MLRRVAFALALFAASTSGFAGPTQGGAIPVPLPLFPMNNWWNTDITSAPVDSNSANFISFIGTSVPLHPDWGGDNGNGTLYGFPYIIVDASQPKKTVTFDTPDESDGVIDLELAPGVHRPASRCASFRGGRRGHLQRPRPRTSASHRASRLTLRYGHVRRVVSPDGALRRSDIIYGFKSLRTYSAR